MENLFEKEINRSTIFEDRNVLSPHYLPDQLPYREEEITKVMKVIAPALSQKRPSNLFLYGKTGVGKTAVVKHVMEKLDETKKKYEAQVDSIYLNCRTHNTKYQVLLKLAQRAEPNESFLGLSSTHLYEKFVEYVDKGLVFIVVLDEIDKVKDLDDLVYALTRANDDLKKGHIALVGISNKINFKEKLDPRSKSTLCQDEMVFAPYNAEQLSAILADRAKEGFRKGYITDGAIGLAAAFAAQESGDARYALRLLLKAGEFADAQDTKATEEYVKKARSAVEEDIVIELINTLPEHQSIVLYAIANLTAEGSKYRRLTDNGERLLFSGEAYEGYESLCKKWKTMARSARWFREYLNELDMMGLITMTMSGPGIRGNTRLIKLSFPPGKVKAAVEKRFA
ncbi:MAG: orc1/cdc6 family replication initiation protein [Candidatus Diapherotrites archaeon]|nr:orc1/cdc6 family replication initiation protein [Candidatus Diapherotrites archaeon]